MWAQKWTYYEKTEVLVCISRFTEKVLGRLRSRLVCCECEVTEGCVVGMKE